jgi:hypothetical protein
MISSDRFTGEHRPICGKPLRRSRKRLARTLFGAAGVAWLLTPQWRGP